MEKEYYIDRKINKNSLYDKVEELAFAANLPITYSNYNFKYGFSDMKRSKNVYYYQEYSKSIFIFLEDAKVRLAYFDNDLAEVYDVDLAHENTYSYYSYRDGKVTEIKINSRNISLTSSNNLTKKFKSILNELGVRMNNRRNRNVEYCSFELNLPKLIEDEKKISEPMLYIPECRVTIIDGNQGESYSIEKDILSMKYQEYSFLLTPSIFKSDILSHFAINNLEQVEGQHFINPKNIDGITKLLTPLRLAPVKSITDSIIYNSDNENKTKYLLRYYDEIIHALKYFQNEDLDKFYTFEDDLNRLQLK